MTRILCGTDVAAVFIARCRTRSNEPDADAIKKARYSVYNWARDGKIQNYGGSQRSTALWDLYEIRDVLGNGPTLVVL